jgi:hypothetical protein
MALPSDWNLSFEYLMFIGQIVSVLVLLVSVGEDEIFNASGGDKGDLEFALCYQLNNSNEGWPIFVGNILATIPTGSSPFDVEFVQSTPGAEFPA